MNKKIKPMIYILIAAFIVQQCTSINITSASIFRSSKLNAFPYIKDGVVSDNYAIQRLSDDRGWGHITYSAEHNFFLVRGHQYLKKIDNTGNEIIRFKTDEHRKLADFTHYYFNENGVYDLSEKNIKEVLFKEIINQNKLLEPKVWLKLFDEYYKKAQVVVYGNEQYEFPIYFRIEKEWIKLFTIKGESGRTGPHELKHSYKGYPAKFTRTILLKDPLKKTFSNQLYELDDWVQSYDKRDSIKNYAFKYSNASKIKSLFYSKEKIDEYISYTPIPHLISGTAYYQLKVKNDILSFKAKAVKPIFGVGIDNHFQWYILPDAYFKNTDVSFLYLLCPSDYQQNGNNNGLYIIKKRQLNP